MMTRDKIQTVLDALEAMQGYQAYLKDTAESAIAILTESLAEPSEDKPYCCYCESANEGIRSTYFDQTCEGCVKRMTHPAPSKPAPLPELTDADIISMAYDCNALPECITDKSLMVFARAILAAAREKAK